MFRCWVLLRDLESDINMCFISTNIQPITEGYEFEDAVAFREVWFKCTK